LRTTLYMAALSTVRKNGVFKDFYTRLRAKNKPAKVALTAVARKLINLLLKNPHCIATQLLSDRPSTGGEEYQTFRVTPTFGATNPFWRTTHRTRLVRFCSPR
jgi:hypothetical protein